ncbi:MAG: hypothetical protein LBT22_01085 [Peptococcaceae bacterium]|nr:hypothetical protein [Peptococcaceae bacterium]
MRIGEVNSDNYSLYLKLLGVKNTRSLDKLLGKSKGDIPGVTRPRTLEECNEASIRAGYAERWQFVSEGDNRWKKIVSVPDDIKQAIINKRREGILENANFTLSAKSGDEEAALIMNYVKTLPESERLSASWTLQKIAQAEGARIGKYLKSVIPNLQPGIAFDRGILTDTNYGLGDKHLDITV